ERGWMLEEDKDGEAVLSILNDNGPTCFLRRGAGRTWRGRWLSYDRMPVELSPAKETGEVIVGGGPALDTQA
ncbi:MAG TPA: hypothetical protein VD861_18475, partial [Pyrinomonadaceae bacterium]|nr:hypothetical protein [Pyrinomonadaceae bacterium]